MPSILLTATAVEPVTLEETKAFLRGGHNDDDEVIAEQAGKVFRLGSTPALTGDVAQ